VSKIGIYLMTFFGLASLLACGGAQRQSDVDVRLAGMERRIARLEERANQNEQAVIGLEQKREKRNAAKGVLRRLEGPDPKAVFAVEIDGAPYTGPKHAWVTIVKAFDFACPYCERSRKTMETLRTVYGDDVKVAYKYFVVHEDKATLPARAACAAHMQGSFQAMYERIWEKGYKAGGDLSRAKMLELGRDVGLNMAKFEHDMDGPCIEKVRADMADMARLGASGTPTFWVNGRYLAGSQPVELFRVLIDEELAKAKASGIEKDKYYGHLLEIGKRKFEAK
jgi:protein-disulfide isomerase